MYEIVEKRAKGKTYQIITLAKLTNSIVIDLTARAEIVNDHANRLGITLNPKPISVYQFLKYKTVGDNHTILIDELDYFLKQVSGKLNDTLINELKAKLIGYTSSSYESLDNLKTITGPLQNE